MYLLYLDESSALTCRFFIRRCSSAWCALHALPGKPTHIMDIFRMAQSRGWYKGRDLRALRNGATGTLDTRVKKGDTFYKPEPGVYGLLEWGPGQT